MIYLPALALVTTAFWFALSGQTSWLFLTLAAISIVLALALALRLRVVDREGSPYFRLAQLIAYAGWLGVEIVKSNVAVVKSVLGPRHAISPALVRVPISDRSGLARALFANSITMTPGTVTIDVADDFLLVHALNDANARPEDFAAMDQRSRKAADGGRPS